MKIDINKRQYENIIKAFETSTAIYGDLSDFVDDKYKKDNDNLEITKKELLRYANFFDFDKNTENFEGEIILREKYYEKIFDDVFLYDDHQLYLNLADKLGWRDFRAKYTEKEIKKMSEEHGGYLGVPLYDFEKKYYDEFEKNGYDRLYIKE